MFNKNRNEPSREYYENMQLNRIYYELEEINRRLRNLNNRLRRVEGFLGLTAEDDNKQAKLLAKYSSKSYCNVGGDFMYYSMPTYGYGGMPQYGCCNNNNKGGYSYALILVLFILLVIIGATRWN